MKDIEGKAEREERDKETKRKRKTKPIVKGPQERDLGAALDFDTLDLST